MTAGGVKVARAVFILGPWPLAHFIYMQQTQEWSEQFVGAYHAAFHCTWIAVELVSGTALAISSHSRTRV